MSNIIRKISIGSDYKNDAMHYNIHIKKNNEVLPWKKFNSNMAISIEYDLQY